MKFPLFAPYLITSSLALWPIPKSYEHGDAVLWILKNVTFYWYEAGVRNLDYHTGQAPFLFASNSNTDTLSQINAGEGLSLHRHYTEPFQDYNHEREVEGVSSEDIIDYAIRSAWKTILKQGFYPWKFHPRNWDEPSRGKKARYVDHVNICLLASDLSDVAKALAGDVDESYTLILTEEGVATVAANSSVGIARGLTTFTQLFFQHSDGEHVYTPLAPITIQDEPKFEHRGINLDVSRNFIPVPDIKRQIDAAAYTKMNRLHLHATDSQSWPLEIPSSSNLARKGAYRPDLIYTAADFADLQRHAALQGIQLITEIDMPGHTSSIWYSAPDLIAAYNQQPDWDTYAAEPPSGTLKLNSTAVDKFLNTLFSDLMPRVKPYTAYFHTGGDEVNLNAYSLDDTVKSSDPEVLQPLMQAFVSTNHERVRKAGLTPVVWEEMLLTWNLTLGSDVIVQSWQSDEAVLSIVQAGHKALVGNYKYWYLDCGKGQWLDFAPGSPSRDAWPYDDYCAPFHNWRLIYSKDPYEGIPEHLQHLVIGGEAHMWGEQTDVVNLDQMVWPRAAAVGEVLWSGAKDSEGQNRSQIEASPRLSDLRERLLAKGVKAEPVRMPYCEMESEGGRRPQCQLGLT
ncbi:glycoside hydrolase family 20 protein [Macroventuria anomochaeta]|uniref:Glycoside hydrolase family 20 protein n=1 Tax=Macroventuria anomochaeta TaxID=301207 RepID=A0ACB6RXV7_9PLEO|nr:glycoside hydrolase family 20 protein [Macroventuria anomochaeta]KAF2625717.1 glycoside hydrolase family 20 protein [Macroventuria anomochaeta]